MTRAPLLALIILVLVLAAAAPAIVEAQTRGIGDVEVLRYVLPSRVHPNTTGFRVHASNSQMNVTIFSALRFTGVYFADLDLLPRDDGWMVFCLNCAKASPCALGGGGAFAKRRNSTWDCD